MSSDLGSLALNSDPQSPFAGYNLVAYQSSKTALNAVTVAYAKELRDTGIKVNAANPGFTATDLNGHRGYRAPSQGAVVLCAGDSGEPGAIGRVVLGSDGSPSCVSASRPQLPPPPLPAIRSLIRKFDAWRKLSGHFRHIFFRRARMFRLKPCRAHKLGFQMPH
jgi:hypothetical protein